MGSGTFFRLAQSPLSYSSYVAENILTTESRRRGGSDSLGTLLSNAPELSDDFVISTETRWLREIKKSKCLRVSLVHSLIPVSEEANRGHR